MFCTGNLCHVDATWFDVPSSAAEPLGWLLMWRGLCRMNTQTSGPPSGRTCWACYRRDQGWLTCSAGSWPPLMMMSSVWTFQGVQHNRNGCLVCLILGRHFAFGWGFMAMFCMLLRSFEDRKAAMFSLPADISVVSVRQDFIFTSVVRDTFNQTHMSLKTVPSNTWVTCLACAWLIMSSQC